VAGGGRTVFITGASSGLGAALASRYAAAGWAVGMAGRNPERLQGVAAGFGAKATLYPLDVGEPAALQAAADDFVRRHGVPEVVIANAGVSVGTLTDYAEDLAAFERVLRTNVLGMAATFQPFLAPMRRARQGTLVGIASVAGVRGLPGAGAYSASKAAAITYLESLRVELRGSGVRVATICPGYVETPMTAVNDYPMPFLIKAEEAARRIARAIDRGASYAVIPWQMGVVAKLLRLLPNPVFDALFARAGRKPRGLPI
jgi:NAD(P)-dependent dehydrogenase (short-subunit alcohol dehydrogenase family)